MVDAGTLRPEHLTERGDALLRGAWEEARACFEAALAEGESPEALEGLGTAAEWLVDVDTLFAARERAYRLYRRDTNARRAEMPRSRPNPVSQLREPDQMVEHARRGRARSRD
jgi:hypothetical protein